MTCQNEKKKDKEKKKKKEREGERERTQNFLTLGLRTGSCLFLKSVPANLHANRLHIKH